MGFLNAFTDISWVLALRTDTLTAFFSYIPMLMHATFIFGTIAILFWLSPIRGLADLAVTSCFSHVFINLLKVLFAQPRPPVEYQLTRVSSQLGMPSGDALFAVFFWMTIATLVSSRIVRVVSLIIVLVIMISRVYLGVHTPLQVIVGAIFGLILYFVHFSKLMQNVFASWFERGGMVYYWLTFAVVVGFVVMLFPTLVDIRIGVVIISSLIGLGLAATFGIVCREIDEFNIGRVIWGLLLSAAIYWAAYVIPDYDIAVLSGKINVTDFGKYLLLTLNLYWFVPKTYDLLPRKTVRL